MPKTTSRGPIPRERLRVYLVVASLQGLVMVVCTLGVGSGLLAPTRPIDVLANSVSFLTTLALPICVFVMVPRGSVRDRELVLVWLPFTAAAQFSFELLWVIGQPLGWWGNSSRPGWTWMWWQFARSDTRYFGQNPFIFGMEVAAVLAAGFAIWGFVGLVRSDQRASRRVRSLLLALAGLTGLTLNTLVYFVSLARNAFDDVGQGTYGMVKVIGLNGPYLAIGVLVLLAIGRLIISEAVGDSEMPVASDLLDAAPL
jgi:hypothetical protein